MENSKGGSLELISGSVALTEVGAHPKWRLRAGQGSYVAVFERSGKFPVTLKFNATVRQGGGWNSVNFRVANSALQPLVLHKEACQTCVDMCQTRDNMCRARDK